MPCAAMLSLKTFKQLNSMSTPGIFFRIKKVSCMNHNWQGFDYLGPVFCDHCGCLLYGLASQCAGRRYSNAYKCRSYVQPLLSLVVLKIRLPLSNLVSLGATVF